MMRAISLAGTLALASLVVALPQPQQIDLDYVNSFPDPTVSAAPFGAVPTTVDLDQSSAEAAVSQVVAAEGAIAPSSSDSGVQKRDVQVTTVTPPTLGRATVIPVNMYMSSMQAAQATASANATSTPAIAKRQACTSLPTGAGPVPTPDTASAFLAFSAFSSSANSAPTPSGYSNAFTNLKGSSQAYGYMGYDVLSSYDTNKCAQKCSAKSGCLAFNIYFERDPTLAPGTGCDNPASTTVIKCVYYAGPLSANSATNTGQWQDKFQVVIAGSNGYMANSIAAPTGYTTPISLGSAAINAPTDMCGTDTYMGFKLFTSGGFDASLCAAACSAQSVYNSKNPPATGPVQTCQFFNTYMLYKNNKPQGQYCTLYSETWSQSYATNTGYSSNGDKYTIAYSFSSSNVTNPALPPTSCTTPGQCVPNPNPPAGSVCDIVGYIRTENSLMTYSLDANVVDSPAHCAYYCAQTPGCNSVYLGDSDDQFCEMHGGTVSSESFYPDSRSWYSGIDLGCYICDVV